MIVIIIKMLLVLVLCTWAAVSDFQKGIVSNKLIVIFIISALTLNILGWCFVDKSYLTIQITNIGIVWLISILLYAFHIWAGGDCKLIITVALLIPYESYYHILNEKTTLISIIAFTFIIGYIFLIFDSLYCFVKHKHRIEKKKLLSKIKTMLYKWISCVSYIVLFDQLMTYVFSEIITKNQWLLIIVNICIIFIITGIRFLQNKYVVMIIIISGIIVKVVFAQPLINRFMIINYSLVVLLTILRAFIDEYNYEIIDTSSVKAGMILSLATTLQFANSKVVGLPSPSTEDLRSRITVDEAESIKRWEKTKYGTPVIEIVRKIPFAIFISLGTFVFMLLGALKK